eukprot:GHVU01133201.1.p5 GENE.GHVU01133201.1~~GHVU01133201.1.p5  ORF type:complete len:109 (+),score=21.75 GHVU01133201.1:498-824(+)
MTMSCGAESCSQLDQFPLEVVVGARTRINTNTTTTTTTITAAAAAEEAAATPPPHVTILPLRALPTLRREWGGSTRRAATRERWESEWVGGRVSVKIILFGSSFVMKP